MQFKNDATEAIETFNAQPTLQPGAFGWWQVWGARPQHIRPGDIVMVATPGDELPLTETLYVEDTYTAKAAPMLVGIVINGEKFTLGALQPIILVRRGTHNTLA